MNIVLIGYRGSGKTTLGKLLAQRLGWVLVDTDVRIVERAGMSIKEIFAQRGEPGFRDLESAVIADVAAADRQVIAAGGGVVLRPENVAAFKRNGRLVWLQASPECLWQRITGDAQTTATRPNLTATGGLDEVRTLLARRTPLYAAAADLTVDVEHPSLDQAAETILQRLQQSGPKSTG